MREEYDFSKAKRGKYASKIKPGDTNLANCKVRVNMMLDADIVEHFRTLAAKPGAAGYQTLINASLRTLIEEKPAITSTDLVSDENFIKAVAEKVASLSGEAMRK